MRAAERSQYVRGPISPVSAPAVPRVPPGREPRDGDTLVEDRGGNEAGIEGSLGPEGVAGRRQQRHASETPWSRWTWSIGAAALLVRVLAVVVQPLKLSDDDADYQRLAISLATGHGWGVSHVAPGGGPTAFRPPLFPLAMAGVYKVFGVHLIAARLFEAVVGSLAVVVLTVLTWMLWGRRVALVAGVLAAVFPPLVIASASLMSESIAVPLEISCLFSMFVYRRNGRIRWAVLSSALLGLLVLARTEAIVLIIPLALLAIVRRRPRGSTGLAAPAIPTSGTTLRWRALLGPLVVVIATVVVLVPWEIRDRMVMGAWIPLTTQSGYVLAGTYNHTSATDPRYPGAWRPANYDPALAKLIADHPHADEVQLDHLLETSAVDYARSHPAYLGTVFLQNTLRLFDLWSFSTASTSTNSSYGYPGLWGDLEELSALVALALALVGVVLGRDRGDRTQRRIPLAYWLAPLILWVSTVFQEAFPRLRALIDPFLLQLSAVALVAFADRLLRRFPRLLEVIGR